MREDTDIIISRRVKELRKELNISQRILAEIIGTSYSFVGQVERGNCIAKYSAHHIFLIAKHFGCQVSDLYPPIDPLEP